jgi:hypothetical protein
LAGILAAIFHTVLLHALEIHDLDHGAGTLRYGDSKGDAGNVRLDRELNAKFCDDSLSDEFKAICLLLLEKLASILMCR